MILNEKEETFLRYLTKCFNQNKDHLQREDVIKETEIGDQEYDILMKRMEHIGAVDSVQNVMGDKGYAIFFKVSPQAEDIVRQIESQKKQESMPDIVEQLKTRARKNPIVAWLIIIFTIILIFIPFLNSLLEFFDKIKQFFKT